MADYTVTLSDLTVLTGETTADDLKDKLTDIFLERGQTVSELMIKISNFELLATKDDNYTFDFRLYVITEDRSIRIAKYDQDLRIFIHNISTFGLWH